MSIKKETWINILNTGVELLSRIDLTKFGKNIGWRKATNEKIAALEQQILNLTDIIKEKLL